MYSRRGSVALYKCDGFQGCRCEGKYAIDTLTGREGGTAHTITRAEHGFYQMVRPLPTGPVHNVAGTNREKQHGIVTLKNENLKSEILSIVKQDPTKATKNTVLRGLAYKFPWLRMPQEGLKNFIFQEKQRHLPNSGGIIVPQHVKTMRGGTFGREYISTDKGDFFVMYSDFQEAFIKLAKNETIHLMVDGTFKCVPEGYTQLLIAMVYSHDKDMFMPVFFCFMSSREVDSYRFAFGKIRALLEEYGVSPRFITCDFEKALLTTMKNTFPSATFVACFFHFAHALWNRCNYLGLSADQWRAATKAMLFEIKGLAFIPPSKIQPKFEEIKQKFMGLSTGFERFFKYFDKHFMHGTQELSFYVFTQQKLTQNL
eukprot:TRINITY_DN10237_c0_g2_i1.p1 TRINITY_DN10237_c0_g2~~TRINITY_DN10237_c0_g2_i1.p1  ORF type:complete len:371 (-),score=18.00 TRINITY_DN10237_c0_g2_i1:126-1238(-)